MTDNASGVVVAWHDSRTAADAYAQHPGPQGYWGLPGAVINAVRDVPGDQGGFVNLTMFASRFDTLSFGGSTIDYTLWRAIPGAKADARVLASPAEFTPGPKEPIVLAVPTGDKVLFWEYLETLTPFGLPSYGRVLATPYDSTAVYATPVEYMVITHTQSASVFFMSRPVAGISVDNLAPAAPLGLAGVVVYPSTGLAMNWRPNAEVDLDHYNLYRGATPGFVADANSLVAAVGDTAFVDAGWMGSDYYRLTAVDAHGNESGAIALAPSGVSGVGDAAPRLLMAIDQIAPNPFNPATEISFSLPATGQVRVEIHDVMGRRVRTLVDEVRAPGSYRVMWRGLDDAGRSMASGMYLCRLVTPTGAVSRSMTLVK